MRKSCLVSHAFQTIRRQLTVLHHGHRRAVHSRAKPYDAAVIGGGITGLTAAYRLAQDPDCTKVTLYEKSSRLGGWLQSETVDVDGGQVVFEYGPRTLRAGMPACLPMLDLLLSLDLEDQILVTSRKSPAATNRYIYYPDHLVRVPSADPNAGVFRNFWRNVKTLLTEPVFEDVMWRMLTEQSRPPREDAYRNQDESLADFFARRASRKVADNVVSAVYHGIYAGDIYRLSAQTLMGPYRDLEKEERRVLGSLYDLQRERKRFILPDDFLAMHSVEHQRPPEHWRALSQLVKGCSVLTLKDGLGELVRRLTAALNEKSGKVELLTDAGISSISRNQETSDLTVRFGEGNSRIHNRVIATAPAPELAKIILAGVEGDQKVPQRTTRLLEQHNYAVTVMVVNLYYDEPDLIPYHGFGYLIPRSIPFDQNPERALGVIFGTETSAGQDTAPGTKLTVIMGGHWWDDWIESDYPDPDTAISMARSLLERHLGITEAPSVARARLQRNAIPQYTVGHLSRMDDLSQAAREEFGQRLTLAGNWYNVHGVGVTDCITQAYLAASYGVGAHRPDLAGRMTKPLSKLNYRDWDLEGGIATAPVRYFIGTAEDVAVFAVEAK
ncbi:hypothetical protein VTN77DRAFT_4653 [Rasamsonia byssochlamydoides]|uniref:uncharacterized protein n=1 Tax=Rasamsonia byssochlamydoides TaxID=89139 RepID=UPI00374499A1